VPLRRPLIPCLLLLAACGGASAGKNSLVLATVFDSTADTIHARIDGDVPAEQVRRLVQEIAIAPGIRPCPA